jgi:DNA-binding response OmpR family regulator
MKRQYQEAAVRSTSRKHDRAENRDTDPSFQVLLVDDEPEVRQVIADTLNGEKLIIHTADSLAAAREAIAAQQFDLALLDVHLPDGNGLDLAGELSEQTPPTQTIAITGQPSLNQVMAAIRAGAADFVAKPLNIDELNDRVAVALQRRSAESDRHLQVARLKRLCKKLNKARHEITQQVDILCNDLVTAYQELATQMQQVEATTEFRSMIQDELDLEQILRHLLEHVLDKVGPTNAVVFLPDHHGGFAVGGYVNYNQDRNSTRTLLEHLADTVAPRIADETETLLLVDDDQIQNWLEDDAAYLAESQVIAAPCYDGDDVLACVLLFRDTDQPLDDSHVQFISAITPILAQHLVKVINVHHRRTDLFGEEDDSPDDLLGL